MKNTFLLLAGFLVAGTGAFAQTTSDFENQSLPADSFENGVNLTTGGFTSGNAFFVNNYDTSFGGIWSGFALSTMTDSVTEGYLNQYSVSSGSGYNSSAHYVVANAYGDVKIRLTGTSQGRMVNGFYINNSTFTYFSMLNGDGFAKKFGGTNGTDPDFFRVRIGAWYNGAAKTDTVTFYLADFRSATSGDDYIVKRWTWVDLAQLGNVDSLFFLLESSDVGQSGMNTPAYFCVDNFITRDAGLGVNNPAAIGMKAYPNPATDKVVVTTEGTATVQILDNQGRVLETYNSTGSLELATASWSTGIYMIKATTAQGVGVQKLIKQ